MAIPRFSTVADNDAPFYGVESTYKKVYTRDTDDVRLTIWFDGVAFYPLVERTDRAGRPIKGKMLRENVRLVKAIKYAEEWMFDNVSVNKLSA